MVVGGGRRVGGLAGVCVCVCVCVHVCVRSTRALCLPVGSADEG